MRYQTIPCEDESEHFHTLREAPGLAVLVGPAGSGKSTFIHRFIRHLSERPGFDHRTIFYFDCNTSPGGLRIASFLDSDDDSVDGIVGRSLRSRFLASKNQQKAFLDWISDQLHQSERESEGPYDGWWREYLRSFSLTFGDDLPTTKNIFDLIRRSADSSSKRRNALHSFYEHASNPAFAALFMRYARECTADSPFFFVFDNVDALPNEWQVRILHRVRTLLERSPPDTRTLIAMREENIAHPAWARGARSQQRITMLAPGVCNADEALRPIAETRTTFQNRVLQRTAERVLATVLDENHEWPDGEVEHARTYINNWLNVFSKNRVSDIFNHNLRYQTEFLFRAIHYSLGGAVGSNQRRVAVENAIATTTIDDSFLYSIGYHAWPETPKEQWPWLGTEHPGEDVGILMHLVLAWLNNHSQGSKEPGAPIVQFADLARDFQRLGVSNAQLRRAFWQLYNFGPVRGTLLDVRRRTLKELIEKPDDLSDTDHVWLRPSGQAFVTGLVSKFHFLAGQIDYKNGEGPHPYLWNRPGTIVKVLEHASRLNEAEATLVARLRRNQSMSAKACSEWYRSRFGVHGELPSSRLANSIGTYLMHFGEDNLPNIGQELLNETEERLHAALVGIPLSSLEWKSPDWWDRLGAPQNQWDGGDP